MLKSRIQTDLALVVEINFFLVSFFPYNSKFLSHGFYVFDISIIVLHYSVYVPGSPRYYFVLFLLWRCDATRFMSPSFLRFLDHKQRRTTVGRTPLDEWSARRRDLYLTTHNTHNRQISMPPVWFEPTISAWERPQSYALDRAATGTGSPWYYRCK